MACRRMRGAAVLCAVAALAAGCPGVTAAVPAAPELRALNVASGRRCDAAAPRSPRFDVTPMLRESMMVSLWHS